MKRIHGRLLIITGIIHSSFCFIPGILGEYFYRFMKTGFFSISNGIADFPIFGGDIPYADMAAFWFFYTGLFFVMVGLILDYMEKQEVEMPRYLAVWFLVITLIGSYMIPLSGMTFAMIPQAIFMLIRSRKKKNIDSTMK